MHILFFERYIRTYVNVFYFSVRISSSHEFNPCRFYTAVVCCAAASINDAAATQLTVSLSRQDRGLLKMSLVPQALSSGRPGPLVIDDMYGTGIAIADKLQVLCAHFSILYSVSQKNVPSLTGYSFNTHPPIFIIFCTCHQHAFKNWLPV